MTEKPSHQAGNPGDINGDSDVLGKLLGLTATRDVHALLRQSLDLVIQAFQAEAGSALFRIRPPQRLRTGSLPAEALATIDRWEAVVERRLLEGMWCIPSAEEPPTTVKRLPTSNLVLVNTPLLSDTHVVGSISLLVLPGRPFGPPQRRTLGKFGRGIGQLASLAADLSLAQQRLNRLGFFYQMGQALVDNFDLNELLDNTMQLASDLMNAGAASLMLIDEARGDLVFEVSHGSRSEMLRRQRIPIDEGLAGWVVRNAKPAIANDARADSRFSPRVDVRTGFLTQSIAAVPLKIRGRVIGVLEVLNKYAGGGFDIDDVRLLTAVGAQAAFAIENARLFADLRDEHDQIIRAQEDVRRELARNLHDGTVQMLSAISMSIDHLERLLEMRPEAALSELDALRKLVHQTAREARMVLFELRPIILETQGLVPTLESYVKQLNETEDFAVHFEPADLPVQFDTQTGGTIFSIVQEAVNNAKRHSGASNLWISLSVADASLIVTVRDDGRGFNVADVQKNYEKRGSFGMLNMRERTRLIDGQLSIQSGIAPPNRGTKVVLKVPIPVPADQTVRPSRRIVRGSEFGYD